MVEGVEMQAERRKEVQVPVILAEHQRILDTLEPEP